MKGVCSLMRNRGLLRGFTDGVERLVGLLGSVDNGLLLVGWEWFKGQ